MCPVQPQLHDDGLGLLAFEHVAAKPARLSSSQDTILYFILLLLLLILDQNTETNLYNAYNSS